MQNPAIQIVGAGPAGSAAAIAALSEGAQVHIVERACRPRQKVCGEFIPAEACRLLDELGVWEDFLRLNPGRIRRCVLCFGPRRKQWRLNETGFGLSRLELDRLLLERSLAMGAAVSRGDFFQMRQWTGTGPLILANGRTSMLPRAGRLFGFKTHFRGPTEDAVELHFTRFGYVGISPVENNLTNVCGLAPENVLRTRGFDIDELLENEPAIAARLRPLCRAMPWLNVGPLMFSGVGEHAPTMKLVYPAGDALGFVDPFTGSGILNAMLTGHLSGICAARRIAAEDYVRRCRRLLGRPFAVAGLFRALVGAGLGDLACLVPGEWLYHLTRPRVAITSQASAGLTLSAILGQRKE